MTACKRCGGNGLEADGSGLRGLRTLGGLSLRAMGSRIGFSHVYLGQVETGKGISGVQLSRLAAAYGEAVREELGPEQALACGSAIVTAGSLNPRPMSGKAARAMLRYPARVRLGL